MIPLQAVGLLLASFTLVTGHYNPGNTYSNCIQPVRSVACRSRHILKYGFRTFDGSCNNLRVPTAGARNTPLRRFLRAEYVDGRDTPYGFPSYPPISPPNEISGKLFKTEFKNKGTGHLTVLFMTFGQFLDHDLALAPHPPNRDVNCALINAFKYPSFPILFKNGGARCTGFSRAQPVCQNRRLNIPRNQMNVLTSFIDGSMIYGTNLARARELRSFDGKGTLKILHNGLLPRDLKRRNCPVRGGCSLAGDNRVDENTPLHTMHTIWVREHNRISKGLKKINPTWTDELLYQSARKIIIGIWQHIVYTEWLPHVVRLRRYLRYNDRLNPAIGNSFTTAALRFGHSLIPNKLSQLNRNFDYLYAPVSIQAAFRNRNLVNNRGIESTVFGLIGNKSNNIDNGFAFGIARRLFVGLGRHQHMDLTAFNIQRGRDHGLPRYGKWRKACNLPTLHSLNDLYKYMLPGTVPNFRKLYKSPNDIDLFAAAISERPIPGLQTGPTFACIMKHQFKMLRDGDRYFYLNYGVFTNYQLRQIRKASMARVMCNTLKGIVSIQPKALQIPTGRNKRIICGRIPKLDLNAWKR